jgi:hypothetical protein
VWLANARLRSYAASVDRTPSYAENSFNREAFMMIELGWAEKIEAPFTQISFAPPVRGNELRGHMRTIARSHTG